ncbi:MAG TPA: tetratricopeptide repeat protein [Bacteroidota bacterium]|nr:tetratricopeptide repeat protein [Bacteroidota bacterium]
MKKTLLLLTVLFPATLIAQEQNTMRLRLAQSFEQGGDWERAAALYETLYQSDPVNYVYFDGLRRCYINLKQYDQAIALIEERMRLQSYDPTLMSSLASIRYHKGEEAAADSIWQSVLRRDPKNASIYRLVASNMIEVRLYDKAITTYLKARSETGNQRLFAEDLAALYGALQQYDLATKEYCNILQVTPQQLSYIQSRISSYTIRDEGIQAALRVVREEVRRAQENTALRTLLGWLYMERKDFESAYEEYRTLDRLTKMNGAEIFNFANRAFHEGAYAVAAKAFREVIDRYPVEGRLPFARLGYARAIEELSEESDTTKAPSAIPQTETRPSYRGAIVLYEKVIADYPNSEVASQAHYRIGVIKRSRFGDLDGALKSFEAVRVLAINLHHVVEATFGMGEIFIEQNNLAKARQEFESLFRQAPLIRRLPGQQAFATFPDQAKERALFALAELEYFEGKTDSALSKLEKLTANIGTDLANDALQLQYFIQENRSTVPAALVEFSRADLLMRQRKFSEALKRFQEIVKMYPTALLVDDALLRIGELQVNLRQYQDALTTFRRLADDMPLSIFRDRAHMRIGEIHEQHLKDPQRAIEAYEQLLVRYPNSLFAEEARKRIRQLRGDAI